MTRPVAGADYWLKGRLRKFIGERVFRAVLIDRNPATRDGDPIAIMAAALDQNSSLILFPEGTRNTSEEPLLPFKSGLYHLARARPDVELVPVMDRKPQPRDAQGRVRADPAAVHRHAGRSGRARCRRSKAAFLDRSRNALLALAATQRE